MPNRYCADCGRFLSRESYSKNQWSKGHGASRCSGCVHGGGGTADAAVMIDPAQTARRNNSSKATFTSDALDNPFASGNFRWVANGTYTQGNRAGEACVCKWFKTGGVMEAHFYDADLAACNEALRLITKWNSSRLVDRIVKINLPEVWTFSQESRVSWRGRKVLQEPFIKDYQKFNSNTGWSDDTLPWPRVMQALSHFTYHISNGQKLLCDLQGGIYKDGVVLTDPVVMSVSREYGPTDLGANGISSFFAHHQCNEFCKSDWRQPHNPTKFYARTAGTTMEHVPTHNSRQRMTHAPRYY
jgi:Alpha-kinase family